MEDEHSVSSFDDNSDFNEELNSDAYSEQDLEETQEDREFINDDDDDDEDEALEEDVKEAEPRRKHKKISQRQVRSTDLSSDLDEDDLELIAENIGKTQSATKKGHFRRLVSKSHQRNIFSDDDNEDAENSSKSSYRTSNQLERLFENDNDLHVDEDNEDDLEDFIVYDDSLEKPSAPKTINLKNKTTSKVEKRINQTKEPLLSSGKEAKIQEKRSKSRIGISSSAWQDIQSIFGDGTDYAYAFSEPQEDVSALPLTSIRDHFEPALLSQKMFTSEDDRIRETDMPERMLTRAIPVRPPSGSEELREESLWISNQILLLQKNSRPPATDETFLRSFVKAILGVLKLMREDFLEIPFIATHRKELCQGILNLDDLWCIWDLDEKWSSFFDRRERLRNSLNKFKSAESVQIDSQSAKQTESLPMIKQIESFLDLASQESELLGLQQFIDFQQQQKQTAESPIALFLNSFCLQSWELGSLLFDGTNSTFLFPPEPSNPPSQEALHFLTPQIPTYDLLLEKAIAMKSSQIAADPWVKKYLQRTAKIFLSTTPTEQGRREIDAFHEFYPFKYLTKKPIDEFSTSSSDSLEQFLIIHKAEKANMIKINFMVEADQENSDVLHHFLFPDHASPWNLLREKIWQKARNDYLDSWLIESARNSLLEKASCWLEEACRCNLQERIMVSPISLSPAIQQSISQRDGFCVMAISVGKGDLKSQIHVSIIDNFCRTIHQETWNSHSDYSHSLTALLTQHSVILIGIAGLSMATRRLYEGIKAIASNNTVLYIPDDVARIELSLDPASSLFAYTASLGRKAIFPLYEYARLYSTSTSAFLSLQFHSLQGLLSKERLQNSIERAFVNVVNLVGVDFNITTSSRHTTAFNVLQFICGLGIRKAHFLRDKINQGNAIFIEKRSDISQLLGKVVYTNCASFLRVDPDYFPHLSHSYSTSKSSNDPLDLTRIHPESYYIARKMAANALDVEESPDDDSFNQQLLITEAMRLSHKLNELDLNGFATELEKTHSVFKFITLQDIKTELHFPFRVTSFIPFQGATDDCIFEMLTGENDSSLFPGLVISGTVGKIIENRTVFVRFDSGISGILSFRNLDQGIALRINDLIVCRVLSISKDRFSVEVTARSSELAIITSKYSPPPALQSCDNFQSLWSAISPSIRTPDSYFDVERERKDLALLEEMNRKHEQALNASRLISHSSYRPWTRQQVQKWLDEHGAAGDFLFRPSTQGIDHLTLTIKLHQLPGRFLHFDISESGKSRSASLGSSLLIGTESYSNLDEVIDRLVHPLMDYVNEIIFHSKFIPTPTPEDPQSTTLTHNSSTTCTTDAALDSYIGTTLVSQKLADPSKIPYALWESIDRPGLFWFGWVPGTKTLRKESIQVLARGFKFKGECFENLSDLINWFKRTCNKM